MNILLTNDDGIAAPGLWAAARALAGLGSVLVAAPARNYSGYGAALPPVKSIPYFPYTRAEGHPRGVTAFGLEAPPASCVQAGLSGALSGAKIDLVVSGINDAANLGRDVLYSGTVGAAMTAHVLGVPAVAVSLAAAPASQAHHWETAAWAIGEVVAMWLAYEGVQGAAPLLFNVNVPNLPRDEVAGVFVTCLLSRDSCLTKYAFITRTDDGAGSVMSVIPRNSPRPASPELWSDAWAVASSYVSVTPLRLFADELHASPAAPVGETVRALPVFTAVANG